MARDLNDRIDRIKREIDGPRGDWQANKEVSKGWRMLLRKTIRPLFKRTKARFRGDNEVAVNWGAEGEDEVHLSAQNRRTKRIFVLQYRCYRPDRLILRAITVLPPFARNPDETRHKESLEVASISKSTVGEDLDELLKFAYRGSSWP